MANGLVLTGGGARAAYQVGVLIAIDEILARAAKRDAPLPFPILCGTSAGAINVAALACHSHNFSEAVIQLKKIWSDIQTKDIYRVDPRSLSHTTLRWLNALILGWATQHNPGSLLDSQPLSELLNTLFKPEKVSQAIHNGTLHALAVSASSYTSGQHLTFYQAQGHIKPWVRARRSAQPDIISAQHLLASCAIPFIFPAVMLPRGNGKEYFGDGAIHQIAPISPTIHLGAHKILVVGGNTPDQKYTPTNHPVYPSLAQIGGHALSSLFLDSLAHDIDNIYRLNEVLDVIPTAQQQTAPLQHIDVLVISPSQNLETLALKHLRTLPRSLRILLRGIGISYHSGATLLSYLLFEGSYTKALMEIGRNDALAMASEIKQFLNLPA